MSIIFKLHCYPYTCRKLICGFHFSLYPLHETYFISIGTFSFCIDLLEENLLLYKNQIVYLAKNIIKEMFSFLSFGVQQIISNYEN